MQERKQVRERERERGMGKASWEKEQDEGRKEESKGQSGAKRAPQASKVFLQR